MGKYARIQKYLENQTPDYTSLNLVPRGTPLFPDLLLIGEIRFAKRLGSNFAALNPENQMKLSAPAEVDQTTLTVERVIPWLEVGALLTFNGTEMITVADWDTTFNTVIINEQIKTRKEDASLLTLWATPLKVHVTASAGTNQVVVRSRYNLLNGDVITLPISDELNSLKQFNVILAETAGASGDPEFPHLFLLTLDQNFPITLLALTNRIYLRAYPSYLSQTTSVPKLTPSLMGPFILDYLSTPLKSTVSYKETFSLRTFDPAGGVILGNPNALVTVNKNYPVIQRPIRAENLLFWKIKKGSGGFISPNRMILKTDAEGKVRLTTRLVPTFPAGTNYSFKVTSTADGLFRFWRGEALGFIDYNLVANVPQVVTLAIPQPLDEVDFIAKLEVPGRTVTIQDSTISGSTVSTFQYGYVFQVVGTNNFQATSIIVKPYFLSLRDLTARYDEGKTYNSGLIYL